MKLPRTSLLLFGRTPPASQSSCSIFLSSIYHFRGHRTLMKARNSILDRSHRHRSWYMGLILLHKSILDLSNLNRMLLYSNRVTIDFTFIFSYFLFFGVQYFCIIIFWLFFLLLLFLLFFFFFLSFICFFYFFFFCILCFFFRLLLLKW